MADLDVVVVGAGFSGIYAVHAFRSAGLTVRAFEAGDGVGGTWYWNRYPGARCDVESKDYSYSFSPELEQDWSWSER
ncbi:MAG TPA: NAD(P)-binding protein, partial [Trebonia sp.]